MADLQPLLDELRAKHKVVGATLGVLENDRVESAASGLLNLDTDVSCTPDSVFQIGSIGKIFTTTLIMQLVDEGRLAVEDSVVKHLPDFTLADSAAAQAITIRQLLNHTSGIDGDFFPRDDPEGPSTLSYVRKMALLGSLYVPGKGPMTYCNAGFVVAGRIVEVLSGMPWPRAVIQKIARPLGLTHYFSDPRESLRFRCAMGHINDPHDLTKTLTAPATYLGLSAAAAGSVLSMSVESLLKFARVHLANGRYGGDESLLSEKSALRMRKDLIEVPPFTHVGITHWGLGWLAAKGLGYEMIGHDGGTLGQYTYLRIYPEKRTAFALFTNSPSLKLMEDVERTLMPRLAGAPYPKDRPREDFTPEVMRYVGYYANVAAEYRVEEKDGGLALHIVSKYGFPDLHAKLEPWRQDVFVIRGTPSDGQKVVFLDGEKDGRFEFIRLGTRMGRRASMN